MPILAVSLGYILYMVLRNVVPTRQSYDDRPYSPNSPISSASSVESASTEDSDERLPVLYIKNNLGANSSGVEIRLGITDICANTYAVRTNGGNVPSPKILITKIVKYKSMNTMFRYVGIHNIASYLRDSTRWHVLLGINNPDIDHLIRESGVVAIYWRNV